MDAIKVENGLQLREIDKNVSTSDAQPLLPGDSNPPVEMQQIPMPTPPSHAEQQQVISQDYPILTIALIVVNVLIFIAMMLAGGTTNPRNLLLFGALVGPTFRSGDFSTLLTSVFIHLGILHLAFNMYALWVMGRLLENFLGTVRFAAVYFISAITGSLLSLCFVKAVSAGASGAIFGVAGAMLILGYRYKKILSPQLLRVFGQGAVPFFLFNLVFGLATPGINIVAHLGGAIGGAGCAFIFGPQKDRRPIRRFALGGALLTVFIAFIYHLGFLVFMGQSQGPLLLARSALNKGNVNAKNNNGLTPLHQAAVSGHKDAVELLLANKADVNAKSNNGETPLHMAVMLGRKDVAKVLLAHGADVNAKANSGFMPLHIAALMGSKDVAELLLANKAAVNAKANGGETPLYEALAMGSKDVAEFLLANKAEINSKDNNGETLLHKAAVRGKKAVAEFLLAHKADVNSKDNNGYTPLYWAAQKGHKDIVELLLACKAEVNAKSNNGITPLYSAVLNGHKDIVELLRQHGGYK